MCDGSWLETAFNFCLVFAFRITYDSPLLVSSVNYFVVKSGLLHSPSDVCWGRVGDPVYNVMIPYITSLRSFNYSSCGCFSKEGNLRILLSLGFGGLGASRV